MTLPVRCGPRSPAPQIAQIMWDINDRINAVVHFATSDELDSQRAQWANDSGAVGDSRYRTVMIKDCIDVAGWPTRLGAKAYEEGTAPDNAEVVQRLLDAGCLITGKTATSELMMTLRPHPDLKPCLNPWSVERTAGASSGGSAAAVAAGLCWGAVGTDTGGSIRMPSSFTGITGLRPSRRSRLPTRGVFHLSPTFDAVGPMARDVRDVADMFYAMSGSCSGPRPATTTARQPSLEGITVGVIAGSFLDHVDVSILCSIDEAGHVLEGQGAHVRDVAFGDQEIVCQSLRTLIMSEAIALHATQLRRNPESFSDEVRARLEYASRLTASDVKAATEVAKAWRQHVESIFNSVDILVCPTTPVVAPANADINVGRLADLTRLTYPWTLSDSAVLALPCGELDGLPVGMQIIARDGGEHTALTTGKAYQEHTDWHTRRSAIHVDADLSS